MKKFGMIFSILAVLAFIAVPAFSCGGPDCSGSGNFNGSAYAGSNGQDDGIATIPNGSASGEAYGSGETTGTICGSVNDGEATADLQVVGGGLARQTGYTFSILADHSIGVGSKSHAEGVIKGSLGLTSAADRGGSLWHPNYGIAIGSFGGNTSQNTYDESYVGPSPRYGWSSLGSSNGYASQWSEGEIHGIANATSPTYSRFHCSYDDAAHANARVSMAGNSGSESYRYVNSPAAGVRTEGMGTNAFANTDITTNGDSSWGLGNYTYGGFGAGGEVNIETTQYGPGLGSAIATGNGAYTGAGALNCNYSGSVTGRTYTYVTTYNGLNGSINGAGSSMSVSSHTSTGMPD